MMTIGESNLRRGSEAASLRRSLSDFFWALGPEAVRSIREGVKAHRCCVVVPTQPIGGHRHGHEARRATQPLATAGRRTRAPAMPAKASGSATQNGQEPVADLGGRRDARDTSGTGCLPSRPLLARPLEVLAHQAWPPAGGSQGRNSEISA